MAHGNDQLDGGAGNDLLRGDDDDYNEGSDTFVFTRDNGEDTITDFDASNSDRPDLIDLRAYLDVLKYQRL